MNNKHEKLTYSPSLSGGEREQVSERMRKYLTDEKNYQHDIQTTCFAEKFF